MESLKRKRARLACKPCRERKRKCDGREPCVTCTEWGYDCCYETPRKRQTGASSSLASGHEPSAIANPAHATSTSVATPPAPAAPTPTAHHVDVDHGGLVRRLEANSGAAFVRRLALKMDASRAPNFNLFGWNIGSRTVPALAFPAALPIVDVTSIQHMRTLAHAYFDQIDRCYGFIDQRRFFEHLELRYTSASSPKLALDYDGILAGVAALGCLFSQRKATSTEVHLVRSARASLDNLHLSGPPSIELLLAWTLHVVYLRLTGTPHETWIASSTLMHLIEASGLYPESPSILLPTHQAYCDPDLQRRIVGVAHHLNEKAGDYTAELLGLLPISVSMDPGHRTHNDTEVELLSTLSSVLESKHTQNPSVMAQCNLVLCLLRRIATHAQGLQELTASPLLSFVLSLLKKGLGCARELIRLWCPWHHAVNVPFHTLIVLLSIDTRASLALLPDAMETLSLVNSAIDSDTTREAYKTAGLLVLLHQQRRKDDLAVYAQTLSIHQEQTLQNDTASESANVPNADLSANGNDWSWMEALVQDIPSLQGMNLEQFLVADLDAL